MTPISAYADTNDKLRLLLQGPPGSGKSTLACQFPNAYVIDIDINLGGPLRFLREKSGALPIGFDVLDKDGDKEVPMSDRYQRLEKLLLEAQVNPVIETIVLDGGTGLVDIIIAEVLRQQKKTAMTKQEWGFFGMAGKKFFGILSSMRKHIVLVVHEKVEKTPEGFVVYPTKVNWPGQTGQIIGAFFTNVWRCEVQVIPSGANSIYKWLIRTMPDSKYELKNSLGLPPTFEFSWQTIQTALEKGQKK